MKVEDVPEGYQHAVVAAYIALGAAPGGPDEIDIPSHNDLAFILAAVIPAIQAEALERAAAKLAGIAEVTRAAAQVLLAAQNTAGAERRETQAVAYDAAAAAIRALKESP